ncbi:MAG: hypothetical protein AB7N54_06110 [Alphaproteobacteria bacterium]
MSRPPRSNGVRSPGRLPILLAAAVVTVLAVAGPARAGESLAQHERTAFQMRVLQSDLMVAALLCGLNMQYDAAIRRFRPEMIDSARYLRSYFNRLYGRHGQVELDRFVTVLANRASSRATEQGANFCADASSLLTTVLALPEDGLGAYIRDVVSMPDVPALTTASATPR